MAAMSYVVLARKYRPRNFAEVVGQAHVVQALTNALQQQRLHHAYLFAGTRGVGKTTISRILAKSLNCTGVDGQGDITAAPCGQCPACVAIDQGRFVDYTELDAASNRGVDEVQGLLEQAVYKPVQGRFKVFMIDEVHMLSNTAFNAMLKTLEEPPDYLKFVLATTDPQKVPVTVLSRCLQFNLRQMAPEIIATQLKHVLQQEDVAAEPAALLLLGRAARGSMRDALSLADQAIAYGSGALQLESVRQMLGSADRSVVFALIEALAAGDGAAVMQEVDALRADGQSAATTLEEMAGVLQRMAVAQLAPGHESASNDPDAARIAELAARLPADETQLLYSLCIHGRSELGLAPDEYVGLSMALLRLLPFKADAGTEVAGASAEKKTLPPALPPTETRTSAPSARTTARPQSAVAAPARPDSKKDGVVTGPPTSATPGSSSFVPAVESHEPKSEPAATVTPTEHADSSAIATAENAATPEVAESGPDAAATPLTSAVPSLDDFWDALVRRLLSVRAIRALPSQLALQAQLRSKDGARWTLAVENRTLAGTSVVQRLQAALAAHGHDVVLAVELGPVTDSPALRRASAKAKRLADAKALLMADPFVQELMRDYGARIVPGSIQPL